MNQEALIQTQLSHSDKAFQFYASLGNPKYICAPMVDQSELAFRMLTRKYGCTLAYTPMLNSKIMLLSKPYMKEFFSTCNNDRPLIAQFCGNDPDTMVKAAQMIEDQCDAIDINLGCPQNIAKKGQYGSFLLEKPEIILNMVKALHKAVKIPITCKIRILPSKEKTIELAKSIQDAGCSLLCVHGRTRHQNKNTIGYCDWDIIREIKETLSIPVIANGGIYTFADVERCLIETSVDGVMSAEALLENPALFSGKLYDLDDLAYDYMMMAKEYSARYSEIKAHLFRMLFTGVQEHTDIREKLVKAFSYEDYLNVVIEVQQRRAGQDPEKKLGWYLRFKKHAILPIGEMIEKNIEEAKEKDIEEIPLPQEQKVQ